MHNIHICTYPYTCMAQAVKNLPAIQETQVQILGQEAPLEEEMATHSSMLAWKIPWTEEPGGLYSMELQRVRHNWMTNTHLHMIPYSTLTYYSMGLIYCLHIFFFFHLSVCYSDWVVSMILSSSLLIHSSALFSWLFIAFAQFSSWQMSCLILIGCSL